MKSFFKSKNLLKAMTCLTIQSSFLPLTMVVYQVELVSKELNHFGGIALFFRDWAPGTLTGGELTFVYAPPVSDPLPQSDLTPWILTPCC